MKFTIEIRAAPERKVETILRRFNVDAIDPTGARREAQTVLSQWKMRRGAKARVLNAQGEELYELMD